MTAPVPLGNFDWEPASWRRRAAAQQPAWPDPAALEAVVDELRHMPPLVFAGEARSLRESLAAVQPGDGFLLHAGDCAESFAEFTADNIRDKLKVILQMSVVLTYSTGVPTVKVGRIAGQFAKPRSSPVEKRDGVGAAVVLRRHRQRLRVRRSRAPARSAAHVARLQPGRGDAEPVARVHEGRLRRPEPRAPVEPRVHRVAAGKAVATKRSPTASSGPCTSWPRAASTSEHEVQLHEVDFYTSHEALILGYEEALTRRDSLTGDWYDCSAHLLWIGDRTRQVDGAHVEFLSGVQNPIGVKLGPDVQPDERRRAVPPSRPGPRAGAARAGQPHGRRQRGRDAARRCCGP